MRRGGRDSPGRAWTGLLLCAVLAVSVWTVVLPADEADADGYGHGDPVRRTGSRLYRLYGKEDLKPCTDASVAPGAECYTSHTHIAYDYRVTFWGTAPSSGARLGRQPDYRGRCRTGLTNCWEDDTATQGRLAPWKPLRYECLYLAGTPTAPDCAQPPGGVLIVSGWDRVNFSGVVLTVGEKPAPPPPTTTTTAPPTSVSLSCPAQVVEGSTATVTIGSAGGSSGGTVRFSTSGGTATAGADFVSQSGEHHLPTPGSTRTVRDDPGASGRCTPEGRGGIGRRGGTRRELGRPAARTGA